LASRGLVILSLLLVSGILIAPRALAFANGQNASIVIGQPNFTANTKIAPLLNESRFSDPYDVAFDSSGNLWVVDSADSRILEFTPPFTSDEKASLVLGESSFDTTYEGGGGGLNGTVLYVPQGVAFDSSGNLWVSDSGDNRIVEFKAPFSTGENASLVLGAPNLSTPEFSTQNASQTDLNSPQGLAFDSSGNLWVADSGYYRVVEFKAPFSNGEAASVVLGQDNFTAKDFPNEPACPPTCDQPTAATLYDPTDVAFDSSGNLWVADRGDNRVSEFASPFTNGEAAELWIGGSCSIFGVLVAGNCLGPEDFIAFDHSGTLWVSDTSNGRVLGFPSPFAKGENATVVLGEPDFTTSPGFVDNATQSNLLTPEGIAFDSAGNVWVADDGFNRVLEFPASATGSASTTSTTSQSSVATVSTSTTSAQQTTTTQLPTSATSVQTTSSSTSSSAVPEFPFQVVAAFVLTGLIITSYLVMRRRSGGRVSAGQARPAIKG